MKDPNINKQPVINKAGTEMNFLRALITYPLPYNQPHPIADLLHKL